MKRTKSLLALRPAIAAEIVSDDPLQLFQFNVLRPILKFQNDLLIEITKNHVQKVKGFEKCSKTQKESIIHHTIKTDQSYKKMILGCIIGLFTLEELAHFNKNQSEITKRLVEFIYERIVSQIEKL